MSESHDLIISAYSRTIDEISNFPDDWKRIILLPSTYMKGRIGWQGLKASEFIQAGPFLITGTDFNNGGINWDTCYHISLQRFNEAPLIHIKNDDVLITKDGTIGKVAFVTKCPEKAILNSGVLVLRCKDGSYDHQYLYYILNSVYFEKFISIALGGSTINHLYQRVFEQFEFPAPTSLPEQRKIVRILSTVDAVIEKTEAAIAKYKAIKAGMMCDLFTRGIDDATGKLRPSYEEAPELYRESELGLVPKEWEVVRIEEVSTLVTNGFVGVATPYYETSDNGVKYLYGTNIRKNEITFDDIRYVNRLFHNKQAKSQLRIGDMLTVQSGHIGTSAVVPDNLGDANCHALIITRFVLSEIYPWFVSYYLNSDMGMQGLEKLFIGSTIKHINTSELAKHLILKPQIEEQKAISKRIDSTEFLLRNDFQNLSKMQNLKQALMSELLTGKVRVKYDKEKMEAM